MHAAQNRPKGIDKANDKRNSRRDKNEKKNRKNRQEGEEREVGAVTPTNVSSIATRSGEPRPVEAAADRSVRDHSGSPPSAQEHTRANAHDESRCVPRVLTFAVVKRIDPRLPNTWGHWWIELDGKESYGWWPSPCPMGWRGALLGSDGCLNGIGTPAGGTATRDAYHGDEPDHWFHPTLIVDKADDQVRAEIRAFAHSYVGGFRWQWWWLRQPADNCRTFQQAMFETVGLFEAPEYLYTQGSGCPFMYPFRSVRWRTQDLFAAAAAHVRGWWPAHRRRRGRRAEARRTERPLNAQRDQDASASLTGPKARARARVRGTLPAGQSKPPDRSRRAT